MIATTTPLGTDFVKEIVSMFIKTINDSQLYWARIFWSEFLLFLGKHWIPILAILIILIIIAIIKALMGYWGMLGSILYHYLYYGILLIIGLIWGADIFVSDLFHEICTIILYPVCYVLVRIILDKTGLRRKY